MGGIETDFDGVKPSVDIRNKMKAVKYRWNPNKMIWWAYKNDETLAVAKEICGEGPTVSVTPATVPVQPARTVKKFVRKTPSKDYALKVKIKDIIAADKAQLEVWEKILKDYVNEVMSEDNSDHAGNSVSKSQESVWMNCFRFIAKNLEGLSAVEREYELVFEYSLPGTVHERPDIFLLTDKKVISLEFKRKEAPQIDSNKDDVAQAIRYKERLQNHHKVTKNRAIDVKSYLVCTHKNAVVGNLRGIDILTADNFCDVIVAELRGQSQCSFCDEWLSSAKTEMPDILQTIEIMYREGRIPYISDVNKNCLSNVLGYIDDARKKKKTIIEDREPPKLEKVIDGYTGFLFYDDDCNPLVAMHWQHRFNRMVGRYNDIYRVQMPNITPHVCRHTYCSNMAKSGMNPKTLQYLMGHLDISVIMNVYTHISFDDAEEELKRMEEFRKAQAEIEKKNDTKAVSQKMFKVV